MFTVADPVCVRTPPASKARIVKVRAEPAGSVTVPKATPPTTGMLNTSGGTMSAAVTSTTTVATDVPDTSARTSNMVSTGPGRAPVGSRGRHEPSARTEASVAAIRTRSTALRRDAHRRGPSNPLERGRDRRVARTPRRHQTGRVYGSDAGVMCGPADTTGRGIPVPVLDRGGQLHGLIYHDIGR